MHEPPAIRLPEPCLVVLVGAAGSGKSTFAARHFAADEVLSSDAYRAVLSGDAADQRATGPAFARLHRDLERRLAAGRTTVVDATNVQPRARRELLLRARAAGVPAVAIVLDLPADIVRAQNRQRRARQVVPEDAVGRHLANLGATGGDAALAAEGFTVVVRLASVAEGDAVRFERGPARPAVHGPQADRP